MEVKEIIDIIYRCAYEVRRVLGPGFLERVFQNALFQEITQAGLQCCAEYPLAVMYKGSLIGQYQADLLVEGKVIIELKAVESLNSRHVAQLINYLTATGIDDGILINYGDNYCFRHKTRIYIKN